MMLEQQSLDGAGNQSGREATFANEDGTPATWLHVIPEQDRRRAFAWRAGIGFAIAFGLWGFQYSNGVLDWTRGWFGIVPIAVGLAFAWRAYKKATVRRFSTIHVLFTGTQRIKRALKWWCSAIGVAALIWWVQPEGAKFADYWWYAWPALPVFIVGTGLYLLNGDAVLTPAATKAKVHIDNLEQQAKLDRRASQSASTDAFFESPLVRYPLAGLFLYGAYYFGTAPDVKSGGWYSVGAILLAAIFARELSRWLLFIAFMGAIIWALVAGISALPVSAAIVVGALIIASANKR
ncbi:hypothetical protein WT27_24280 [Burkholderia territorii]|uniref:Uncharacterized protein n=1 Tax=Burkholderia territorii TaxID=1503055 RepID=A0A105VZY9_9BURK|nr:hypothetical protein [Burkholderia territorii]KVV57087.1 hypothetical protein WT27_24280 [Burkholderia territorii]KVX43446.1 hypothetical protein WT31_26645 [Burkholderia territorii]